MRLKLLFLTAPPYISNSMRLKVLFLMALQSLHPLVTTQQFIFMALLPPVAIKQNGDLKISRKLQSPQNIWNIISFSQNFWLSSVQYLLRGSVEKFRGHEISFGNFPATVSFCCKPEQILLLCGIVRVQQNCNNQIAVENILKVLAVQKLNKWKTNHC